MSYEHILVEIEDGVGIVTLNRPDKLNAMNRKLSQELHHAVKAMEADGLIHRHKRFIEIHDWERLRAVSGFNELYLHLDQLA